MARFPAGGQDVHIPLNLEEFVTGLAPGPHTDQPAGRPAPGSATADTYFGWQSGATIGVYEFNAIPGVGSGVDVFPALVMPTASTSRLPGRQFPG